MSKQYLTVHTVDNAHITDIFALAPTSSGLVSASGASSLKIHAAAEGDFAPVQTLEKVHKLGCHHLAASEDGNRLASAGFGGEVKIWSLREGKLEDEGIVLEHNKAGEIWALALSADGQHLASSSFDGRINVWDLADGGKKIREYETKGSFGMCVDISSDSRFTASGHESGAVYLFNNETGRLQHSLAPLGAPVRSVAFSPGCRLLAAAGDSRVIALYDVASGGGGGGGGGGAGEQVAALAGHGAWVLSLAWNGSGEYLLSGAFDGKTKVWSVEQRACVATHSETEHSVWAVTWLPRRAAGRSEMFAVAGANRSISFFREATGG